jgi:hypothetical protein
MEQQAIAVALECTACGNKNEGNFCNVCGENLHPQRLSFSHITKTFPDLFLDVDQGLLYTLRALLRNPAQTIDDFMKGDRSRHYQPLKLLIFMSGLYALLFMSYNIHGTGELMYEGITSKETAQMLEDEYTKCQSIINLVSLPFFSFLTWLFFRKSKWYYGEHLLMNSFVIGFVLFINNVLFPVMLVKNGTAWVDWTENLLILLTFLFALRTYYGLFYTKSTMNLVKASITTGAIILILSLWYFLTSPIIIILKKTIVGD